MKNLSKLIPVTAFCMTMAITIFLGFSKTQELEAAVACATGCRGGYGFAYNYNNVYASQQRALQECHKYCNNCRIFHSNGSRGWGALARNETSGRIGVGTGYRTRHAAERKALRECGRGCIIKHTWKDTVGTK